MCEYNPVVRSFQGRGDLSLLRWIQTVPIYNKWTVIERPPRNLHSSSRIGKEGRGRETRRRCKFLLWRLCEEPAMKKIYTSGSH